MIRPVVTTTISRATPVARVMRKSPARKDAVRLSAEGDEPSDAAEAAPASPFDATGAAWTASAAGAPLSLAVQSALTRLRHGG